MTFSNRVRASAAAAALALASAASSAWAQEAEQPGASADDGEIIVTARRRDERLQDVPAAVSAFSEEGLEALQASTIGDIQAAVPNLTIHVGDAQNAVVYIRGVGQVDSLAFADPGVGIYLDDVYLGRAQGAFLDVYDVERVEVLRGPQGTLHGRNTIGGAVKFVSRALTPEPSGSMELGAGDYGLIEGRASLNMPLIGDTLIGKVAIAGAARDGFSTNSVDGSDDGGKALLAGRVAFDWRPTSDLAFRLNFDASSDRPDTSRTPARATSVFGLFPPNADPFRIDANFNDLSELDTSGVSLTAQWDIADDWILKFITAYRRMNYDTKLDLDATGASFFGVYDDESQRQFSQELQALYSGDRLDFTGGLYFFREDDFTYSGLYAPDIALITASVNDQTNRSMAVYGQGTYELAERLSITAGLRYTYEEKDFFRSQRLFLGPTPPYPVVYDAPGNLEITNVDLTEDWAALTPRLGVDYHFNDDLMAYASISRGFKSGGFDGRANTAAAAAPYDPETLWAYEAGLRSQWMDGRLTANATVFFNDYTDLQLSSFVADAQGNFSALFTNAGKASMYGLELDLAYRPSSADTITANIGYLDGGYEEYIGPGGLDISDQRELVNAPRWSARLGGQHTFSLGAAGALILGADASYRSKTYPTVSSSEVLAQDAYTLVDAFLRYETPDGAWRVTLGGQNLTDERYITQGFDLSDSLGYQLAYYGDPRTWTVRLGMRF